MCSFKIVLDVSFLLFLAVDLVRIDKTVTIAIGFLTDRLTNGS